MIEPKLYYSEKFCKVDSNKVEINAQDDENDNEDNDKADGENNNESDTIPDSDIDSGAHMVWDCERFTIKSRRPTLT